MCREDGMVVTGTIVRILRRGSGSIVMKWTALAASAIAVMGFRSGGIRGDYATGGAETIRPCQHNGKHHQARHELVTDLKHDALKADGDSPAARYVSAGCQVK